MYDPDAVVKEAESWLGTPYHHRARVKGVGVDCANLILAVFESIGALDHVDPEYPRDWHLNRGEERFIAWLEQLGAKRVDTPRKGDVGVWRYGRLYSHGGIFISEVDVIHSYFGMGVIKTRIDQDPLAGRLVQFWRFQ